MPNWEFASIYLSFFLFKLFCKFASCSYLLFLIMCMNRIQKNLFLIDFHKNHMDFQITSAFFQVNFEMLWTQSIITSEVWLFNLIGLAIDCIVLFPAQQSINFSNIFRICSNDITEPCSNTHTHIMLTIHKKARKLQFIARKFTINWSYQNFWNNFNEIQLVFQLSHNVIWHIIKC